jgi:hypothetical protein
VKNKLKHKFFQNSYKTRKKVLFQDQKYYKKRIIKILENKKMSINRSNKKN